MARARRRPEATVEQPAPAGLERAADRAQRDLADAAPKLRVGASERPLVVHRKAIARRLATQPAHQRGEPAGAGLPGECPLGVDRA
jgi:hypothetical protein